jgi:hypothetical protein
MLILGSWYSVDGLGALGTLSTRVCELDLAAVRTFWLGGGGVLAFAFAECDCLLFVDALLSPNRCRQKLVHVTLSE